MDPREGASGGRRYLRELVLQYRKGEPRNEKKWRAPLDNSENGLWYNELNYNTCSLVTE